jgi:RNA polymerase sigma-70 factor, ECF subfamily
LRIHFDCIKSTRVNKCVKYNSNYTHMKELVEKEKILSVGDEKKGQAAIEDVFNDYYGYLQNFAIRYIDDRGLAEDMVQDVFFKVWNKRNKLIIGTSFKTYLMQSVKNRCIQYLRKEKHRNTTSRQLVEDIPQINNSETEPGLSNLFVIEIKEIVQNTMEKLPDKTRRIFFMSRFQHLNNAKIASHFNISEKAIEYHITKALGMLKPRLHDFVT